MPYFHAVCYCLARIKYQTIHVGYYQRIVSIFLFSYRIHLFSLFLVCRTHYRRDRTINYYLFSMDYLFNVMENGFRIIAVTTHFAVCNISSNIRFANYRYREMWFDSCQIAHPSIPCEGFPRIRIKVKSRTCRRAPCTCFQPTLLREYS